MGLLVRKTLSTLLVVGGFCTGVANVALGDGDAVDPAKLIEIGERIYRDGLRPSGEPVRAMLSGDTPIEGTQFSCVSCHQRSGLGSIEGWLVATPVSQAELYRSNNRRPAYTDKTLARAIRQGVDNTGRPFAAAMPGYELDDLEMSGLIAYLKSLSAEISPGVTDEEIHFATVVTAEADAAPMLAVLEAFFQDKNSETRLQTRRREHGPWYRDNRNLPYRKWILHIWPLEGPPTSWNGQLEQHYASQPVFAMVSGISTGSWFPIHEFCEMHGIPCILPNVEVPVLDEDDFYTLYFSRGHELEARTIAEHLTAANEVTDVLQIFRDDPAGDAASGALRAALGSRSRFVLNDLRLGERESLTPETVARATEGQAPDAMVLWVSRDDVGRGEWLRGVEGRPRLYFSSSSLGGDFFVASESFRERAYLVHPFTLPSDFQRRFQYIENWMRARDLEFDDRRIVAQTYFACTMVAEALMHVRFASFYRDFFLECIDHTTDRLVPYSSQYPKPSFGPGQRYISKGCYIVDLARSAESESLEAQWIVPH